MSRYKPAREFTSVSVLTNDDGCASLDTWQTAMLVQIRDELRKLNTLLHCHNTVAIPQILRQIEANTRKPKPRKRKAT